MWHAEIFTPQELQRAAIARADLVVKPVERRGAAHDHRLAGAEDLAALFQAARAASPRGRVMVEQYPQTVRVSAFLEKDRLLAPAEWHGLANRAASALDLRQGPLTIEIAHQDGKAEVIDASPHIEADSPYLEAAIAAATSER